MRALPLLLLAAVVLPLHAQEVPPDLKKSFAEAFKPFKVPPVGALRAEIEPSLPQGIVTEAGPFAALVIKLRASHEPPFAAREEALKALAACPSPASGKLVADALKTVLAECEEARKQVAAVEGVYAKVYNLGFLESGEGARRDRSSSAVLIPYYRTLLSREGEVAARAAEALAALKDGEGFAWLVAEITGKGTVALRRAVAEALGRIGGDEARAALAKAARDAPEPWVRGGALVALMSYPLATVVEPVIAAIADPAWEVRGLAIRISAAGKLLAAVEPLLTALAGEEGRLRLDIDRALGAIAGVRFEADADLWAKWWAENAEGVRARAKKQLESGDLAQPLGPPDAWGGLDDEGGGDREGKGASATFYGISTLSRRVLFVVDVSKSMENDAGAVPAVTGGVKNPYEAPAGKSKLAVAKWQLHRAIHELPAGARFNIVVYSESYKAWGAGMQEAGKSTKAAAHKFVEELAPNGTTNIGDSLDLALAVAGVFPFGAPGTEELPVDTVFLLSDGDPNRGRTSALNDLLEDFSARNVEPWITVHAVGIGEADGSSFLKDLAGRNSGRYVGFK